MDTPIPHRHSPGMIREPDEYDYLPSLDWTHGRVADQISASPHALSTIREVINRMIVNTLYDWGLIVSEDNIDIHITARNVMEGMSFSPTEDPQRLDFHEISPHIFNHTLAVHAPLGGQRLSFSAIKTNTSGTFIVSIVQPDIPEEEDD